MGLLTWLARAEGQRPHIPAVVTDLDDTDHYSGTHRIAGLSDGVFSIAMTLLALPLIEELPRTAQPLAFQAFLDAFLTPILVYAMSFIILGTFWIGHSIQFHYVVRSDRPLMVRTVLFLVFVSLLPFSTAYLSRFEEDHVAIALYCANLALCGVALHSSLIYATKDPKLLHRVFDKRIFRGLRISFLLGPTLYTLAFAVSLMSTRAAFLLCILVPILTFFPNPFWGKAWLWVMRTVEEPGEG
ncbi:MAG: DUF1211 domain-containing protein [Halobacteriales archaeon]|nr:DUF1211 domain-containing protein [Halobacteriales archaeon]